MARIAFDIDDQTKREIKVRLAREGRTLSDVMRAFCLHYKDFGLQAGHPVDSPGVYFTYAKGELQYTINIRLPTWLKERIEKEAKRKLVPLTLVVQELLVEKFGREKTDNVEP